MLSLGSKLRRLGRKLLPPNTPLPHRISASTNVTASFSHSSAPLDTRPIVPPLLHWGGIIGDDKHHYNVPQWVLHLNLHVIAWGVGGRLYVPTCVFMLTIWMSTPVNHAPKSLLLSSSPPRTSSINRRTSGKEDWHHALAFCFHPKYSLLSRMTQRFIRVIVRIVWIRWVSQLSRLGCGRILRILSFSGVPLSVNCSCFII